MSIPRILAGLTALAALGGCQTLEQTIQPVAVAQPSHPTYCYRTLGSVNCYLTPRPGDTLVGVDVPPPKPTAAPPGQAAPPSPSMVETGMQPIAPPPPVTAMPAAEAQGGPARLSPYGTNGSKRPGQSSTEGLYGYSPPPPSQ